MIGILTPISPTILMMTRQFNPQASTWDHHPLHQRTPHQIFFLPTSWPSVSSRVGIGSSSYLMLSVLVIFASGIWSVWLLWQLCLSILPVLLMGTTWWIFILPIRLILGTTLSTSGSGFSITVAMTSLAQRLQLILITFDCLIPLKPMLSAIVFFLIGYTST
jgi:hypothetical protein